MCARTVEAGRKGDGALGWVDHAVAELLVAVAARRDERGGGPIEPELVPFAGWGAEQEDVAIRGGKRGDGVAKEERGREEVTVQLGDPEDEGYGSG
eukprot:2612187-Pleurochrysis_carterae.AAC.1